MKHFLLVSLLAAFALPLRAGDVKSLSDFQAAAEKANEILTIPHWPKTPLEVQAEIDSAIAKANAGLDTIGKQDLGKVTFESIRPKSTAQLRKPTPDSTRSGSKTWARPPLKARLA